ncbi:hypothetical protein LXL04_018526 [Taraxacum kok-saghyz]
MGWSTLVIVLVATTVTFTSARRGGNPDVAALSAFRKAVKDPSKVLETWDSGLTDACTWIHIKCSPDNHVIRVWSTLVIVLAAAFTSTVSGNSEGDALYALRRSLSDPDNILQSWDPNLVSPCTWFHITCNQDNHVTRVDLGNSNLTGYLPTELGSLEHLQELYKNKLQGIIPKELGNLKSLVSLDLYENNLSGSIPASLGNLKALIFLRLNNNQLSGRIPRELKGATNLKVVDVSHNNLCGTFPTTGPFAHIPLSNFENNPRLEGPELMGLASYDTNCT